MKAARVLHYGSPGTIEIVEIAVPEPCEGQIRVKVKAAGVGPWDALIRSGGSGVAQTLPLTLGSDIAGVVDALGANVSEFRIGEEVYGATNAQFTGGYAEYALASAGMIARKPSSLNFIEAASAPVVAVTAWQMLFEYGHARAGQKVLIHGGAGNVGAYAVQMANDAGLDIIATASTADSAYVHSLGAGTVVDYRQRRFDVVVPLVDIVIDTVGGETRERSFRVLKPEGILVSVVSPPSPNEQTTTVAKAVFFFAEVTTARLNTISDLFASGKITPRVGAVLRLEEARRAHEMLAGAPHARGKIVLDISS